MEASSKYKKVMLEPYLLRHYMRSIVEISTGIEMEGELAERIRTLFETLEGGAVTYKFGPLGKPAFEAEAELLEIIRGVLVKSITEYADVIEKVRECGDEFVKEGVRELKKGNLSLLLVLTATSSLSTAPDADHDPNVIDKLAKAILFIWGAGILTNSVTTFSVIFEFGFNHDIRKRLISEQDTTVRRMMANKK